MRCGIKFLLCPTPEKIRNAGDLLLSAFSLAGVGTILAENTTLGLIFLGTGYALKILSNMFTDAPKSEKTKSKK